MIDHVSVVASVPLTSLADLSSVLKALEEGADLVELRLDYLPELDLETLRKEILPKLPKDKVIITVRDPREGGVKPLSNPDRFALLKAASEAGCCIDVEVRNVEYMRSVIDHTVRPDARTIISVHDPTTKSAKELGARVPIWARRSSWVVKGAYPARSWGEMCDIVGASGQVKRDAERYALMGMGPFGQVSRYILPSYGTSLVYCSFGKATAPGQVSLAEFLPVLRSVGAEPRESWLGLLGNGISYSISPQVQNAALRSLGLNWAYIPFDLPPESVEFLRELRDTRHGPRPIGLNVTTPYKEKVIGLMDDLDSEAKAVGAVNTILVGEKLLGANTDVGGYEDALSEAGAPLHETTLIIGAG
ncbi:MAG TPA: type I 3-dehydroquinate dehydratase, partial [Thermoplasmata archaeon]|nr:type I 3-dehydroquinate dehydratase [Thermoplasmata archaeon]